MIKLIAGLGNPGDRYAKTRHNAGFWLLEQLGERFVEERKFFGLYEKVLLGGAPVHLLKPLTFMNASGKSLRALAQFYQLAPEEILVVHDELDLPEGEVRLKFGGGHGGHNGLRDIIAQLGSKDFYRLRLGIDRPRDSSQVVGYVLDAPNRAGQDKIDEALRRGVQILPVLLRDGAEKAMHQLHSKP